MIEVLVLIVFVSIGFLWLGRGSVQTSTTILNTYVTGPCKYDSSNPYQNSQTQSTQIWSQIDIHIENKLKLINLILKYLKVQDLIYDFTELK